MDSYKDMKMLIVDDDKDLREIAREYIEAQIEVEIFEAGDAKEAYWVLQNNRIDLTILDIKMPVVDGLEVLEKIHKKYPDIINIMLSGHGDKTDVMRALKSQAYDFLEKPIDKDLFLNRITNGLDLKYQRDLLSEAIKAFVMNSGSIGSYSKFEKLDFAGKCKMLKVALDIVKKRNLKNLP